MYKISYYELESVLLCYTKDVEGCPPCNLYV